MTSPDEDYDQLYAIVDRARVLADDELETYLTDACGGHSSLRRRVEQLLAAGRDETLDLFADASVGSSRVALGQLVDHAIADWLPERIGDYTIVRQIGRGGMGIVYEAEQRSPKRSVAIKLLHPMHATESRARRLRQEAEALGRLQHRGIAQIYEADHYDVGRGPQPFLAMELVDGVDLCTYSEHENLSLRARLELLAKVADAVQYAHDHGVIHRDLKPDNVLVNQHGQPRVLDFGIARVTDAGSAPSTMLTEDGQLVGTLGYMAPEQLRDDGDVTPQTDVYALGVLGFELLTRRLPRVAENLPVSRAIARLAEGEAPAAGSLDPRLKGDVETILGKALEVDLVRRYRSASALADDLRRHLADQPIEARPPSGVYLVRKFARRHRVLVGGVIATVSMAITGAVIATGYAIEATQRAAELERSIYIANLSAAAGALQVGDLTTAEDILGRAPAKARGWEHDYLCARLEPHSGEWETPSAVLSRPTFDAEGERMFAVLANGEIGTWDVATGRLLRRAPLDLTVAKMPKAATEILLHGPKGRFACHSPARELVIGDIATGRVEVQAVAGIDMIAWDTPGERLLLRWVDPAVDGETDGTGGREAVWVWDGSNAREIFDEGFQHGAFNHAGDRIVLANLGDVVLLDAGTGELLKRIKTDAVVVNIAFSPDDRHIAVAGHNKSLLVLDTHLELTERLPGHKERIVGLCWTMDGQLITTSADQTTRLWPRGAAGVATAWRDGVQSVRYTGDGLLPPGVAKAAVMPGGASVMVVGDRIRVVPLADPSVLAGHDTFVYRVAFSPDGSRLASGEWHRHEVRLWDIDHGGRVESFSLRDAFAFDPNTEARLSDPADRGEDASAFFQALCDRRIDRQWRRRCALSPDGRLAARIEPQAADDAVAIYEQSTEVAPEDRHPVNKTQFATAAVGYLRGHEGSIYCVAFHPDGSRIATGGNDATIRIWDAQTLELLLVLRGHEQYVRDLEWSPDGTQLASASGDATVRLWDSLPLHERRKRASADPTVR